MANIRELNRKVSSLRSMQKVMRAMNMIASTKLRKILPRHPALLAFEEDARVMAAEAGMALDGIDHPLVAQAADVRRICVVMFTSDKGLCGSHNNAVQRTAAAFMESARNRDVDVDAVCIDTRGASFCRRNGYEVHMSVESNDRSLTVGAIRELNGKLVRRVLANEIQEIHFVFNAFVSTLYQRTTTLQVLPLASLLPEEPPQPLPEFALEPVAERFAPIAAERILLFLLRSALRHSHLSEHAARMTAMDNATNNSEDLISRYGAIRNRARQTMITSELTEIVAGKEAMKD